MTRGGGQREQLTLWDAMKDFGWLPMILMGIGGLSLIDILERAVVQNLSLITPLQIALDGYRRITLLIGAYVEPLFRPAVEWINSRLEWSLELQPHWRSVFVLAMTFVMSLSRGTWRGGNRIDAIWVAVAMAFGALAGALLIGLLPLRGTWWVQGLIAAMPVTGVWIALGAGAWVMDLLHGDLRWQPLSGGLLAGTIGGLVAFALGAGLAFVPVIDSGAGIVALAVVIALVGAFLLLAGVSGNDRGASFLGLSMLGGFVAAGLILIANLGAASVS